MDNLNSNNPQKDLIRSERIIKGKREFNIKYYLKANLRIELFVCDKDGDIVFYKDNISDLQKAQKIAFDVWS